MVRMDYPQCSMNLFFAVKFDPVYLLLNAIRYL